MLAALLPLELLYDEAHLQQLPQDRRLVLGVGDCDIRQPEQVMRLLRRPASPHLLNMRRHGVSAIEGGHGSAARLASRRGQQAVLSALLKAQPRLELRPEPAHA